MESQRIDIDRMGKLQCTHRIRASTSIASIGKLISTIVPKGRRNYDKTTYAGTT